VFEVRLLLLVFILSLGIFLSLNATIHLIKNQRESWRDNSISEKFFKLLFDFDDSIFEKFHGYELSGVIGPENLVEGNVSSSTHATGYHVGDQK
jgi:hypothetical protein